MCLFCPYAYFHKVAIPFYEGHVSTLIRSAGSKGKWDLIAISRNPFLWRACFNKILFRRALHRNLSQSLFMKGMFQRDKYNKGKSHWPHYTSRNPFLWRACFNKDKIKFDENGEAIYLGRNPFLWRACFNFWYVLVLSLCIFS